MQQTFGKVLARTADGRPGETVKLPPPFSWIKRGHVIVEEQDSSIVISTRSSEDGVIIPFVARNDEIYSFQMQYRSPQAFAVQMWGVDGEIHKMENLTLYDDRVPESPSTEESARSIHRFSAGPGQYAAECFQQPRC